MWRILLPVAVVAAIFFFPMFSEVTTGPISGETSTPRTGQYFIGETVKCFTKKEFSVAGECAPKHGAIGMSVFAAAAVSAIAAIVGLPGLLPFVGRATSIVTALAGLVATAAAGYFILTVMSKGAAAHVEWGAYLAGGLSLLTLVAGLQGVRGK
ncbi:MAG: hypothetical protein K2Q06_14730 [Parvularculaceae bacterium]|nr:hypothetical protein [Parvularculaceae bacterium]